MSSLSGNNHSQKELHLTRIQDILVVDDEPSIIKVTKRVLEGACDVSVRGAQNIAEMIIRCAEQVPELILMDGKIGHESGVEAMQHLRDAGFSSIIVTHSDTEDRVNAMLELGAVGSISKPTITGLVKDLRSVLNEAGFDIALRLRTSR